MTLNTLFWLSKIKLIFFMIGSTTVKPVLIFSEHITYKNTVNFITFLLLLCFVMLWVTCLKSLSLLVSKLYNLISAAQIQTDDSLNPQERISHFSRTVSALSVCVLASGFNFQGFWTFSFGY